MSPPGCPPGLRSLCWFAVLSWPHRTTFLCIYFALHVWGWRLWSPLSWPPSFRAPPFYSPQLSSLRPSSTLVSVFASVYVCSGFSPDCLPFCSVGYCHACFLAGPCGDFSVLVIAFLNLRTCIWKIHLYTVILQLDFQNFPLLIFCHSIFLFPLFKKICIFFLFLCMLVCV